MNTAERRELLAQVARSLLVIEAENVVDLEKVFLPLPSHHLALRPEVVLVLGGRGAGKSALFNLVSKLSPADLRTFFGGDVPPARWMDAFSDSRYHPPATILDAFGRSAEESSFRSFWVVHLARRLSEQFGDVVPALPEALRDVKVPEGCDAVVAEAARYLDQVETSLTRDDQMVFASYDHLDRLGHFDRAVRDKFVSTLLALWLSLSNRYRKLRGKVFLREDLFEKAQSTFADAGKLRGRSASIEWNVSSLYQLLVRYIAAAGEPALLWLKAIPALELAPWHAFGEMPAEMLEPQQIAFADRLAGRLMGRGVGKGYTYRWIPNRLQDGRGRIVPRSVLNLIGHSCRVAHSDPAGRGSRLITPSDLQAALRPTSEARAREVSEEFLPVQRLGHLRGQNVLIDRATVIQKLDQPSSEEPPGQRMSGEAVFQELVALGVLVVRDDRHGKGRIDVPDIYRYGFGILRKGGVKSPN